MGYNLFLDDIRTPKTTYEYMRLFEYITLEWITVRNYDAFIEMIQKMGIPEIISFDHDLADEHYNPDLYGSETYDKVYDEFEFKTGYDCAKWLINYCIDNKLELPNKIFIHSMNPVGSKNIQSLFENYNKWHKKGLI